MIILGCCESWNKSLLLTVTVHYLFHVAYFQINIIQYLQSQQRMLINLILSIYIILLSFILFYFIWYRCHINIIYWLLLKCTIAITTHLLIKEWLIQITTAKLSPKPIILLFLVLYQLYCVFDAITWFSKFVCWVELLFGLENKILFEVSLNFLSLFFKSILGVPLISLEYLLWLYFDRSTNAPEN